MRVSHVLVRFAQGTCDFQIDTTQNYQAWQLPADQYTCFALSLIGSGWFCEGRSEDRPLRDCTDLCRGRCWHRPETFGDSGLRFGSKRADLMIGPYGIAEPSVGAAMGRPLKMRRKDTMRKIGGAKCGG